VRAGFVNVDRLPLDGVDVVADLTVMPWPWGPGEVTAILALDIVEHLPSLVAFVDECWRVLVPRGELMIRVPRYDSPNAWIDPTHVRPYHADSFRYFVRGDPWRQRYGAFYTPHEWELIALADGPNIEVTLQKGADNG
jgi:SAM-dependent methyltransferase